MGWKQGGLSIAEFLSCFVIYLLTTVGLHEFLHLSVLRQLGGDGYIVLHPLGGGGVVFTKFPTAPYANIWISLAGGVGVFLIYLVFIIWNYKDGSIEELTAIMPIALMQLFYGVYEAGWFNKLSTVDYLNWGNLPLGVGFALGILFPIPYKGGWVPLLYALVDRFVDRFEEKGI